MVFGHRQKEIDRWNNLGKTKMTTNETMPDVIFYDGSDAWTAARHKNVVRYIRADTVTAAVRDAEDYADMIRLLLPLAKGYVHANPGIRSTECIIEDAEDMLEQTNTALAALRGLGD